MKRFRLIKEGSRADNYLTRRYGSTLFTYGQIFGMLLPLVLDKFFMYLIDMLTASMVSSSGQDSVSAVSLVFPIVMIVLTLSFAVASGGTVIIAQYKGMGDSKSLNRAAGQTMLATIAVTLLSTLPFILFASPIVNLLYPAAEVVVKEKAALYLSGICGSLLPFSLYTGGFAILRGIGNTKDCLKLTVIINSVHLLNCLLFINTLKLDIWGTVLSYNLARIVGGVAALYYIVNKRSEVQFKFRSLLQVRWKIQKSIFKIGIPFAAEQVCFNIGSLIMQTYLVTLGTLSVAANSNANTIFNMFIGCGEAVATLAITVVGQCVGAGEKELARRYGKRMMTLGRYAAIFSIIVIFPLLGVLFNLYHAPAEITGIMRNAIIAALIPMPFFWPYSNIMPSVLRAAGDANYSSIISLVTMWVFRVAGGYILAVPCGLGVMGIWYMLGAEWAVKGILFYLRYRGDKWLSKKTVEKT